MGGEKNLHKNKKSRKLGDHFLEKRSRRALFAKLFFFIVYVFGASYLDADDAATKDVVAFALLVCSFLFFVF